MTLGKTPGRGIPDLVIVASACLLLLAGCGDQRRSTLYAGHFTWGHEVRAFRICNSEEEFWLRARPEILLALRDFVEKQTAEPYTPIYLVFSGFPLDEEPQGLAADYGGVIQAVDIITLKKEAPPDCF